MAEIFLAIEHGIEGVRRQVVVKRILPHMAETDDFVTMFMDEARVVARISHPNIVHIYNFGQVDGVYFITMEFVDGLTVSRLQRLARPQPIPIELSLRIMADICAGLHAAHELTDEYGQLLGVIHRDVSPQNILVSKNGMAKLIDFGVARASTQAHATQAGQIKGKLGYIAPEQFHRKIALDRRADVFSAGAVLYELVTGERLFVRETEAATLNAVLYDEPPSLVGRPDIPDMVDAIIRKAVSKSPAGRFSTAFEMQSAIEHLLIRRSYMVSPSIVGAFVAEHMKKAAAARASTEGRAAAESLLPSSAPSGFGRESASSWPSGPSSPSFEPPSRPSFDPAAFEQEMRASQPSMPQPSFEPSSLPSSGVTPTPASDIAPRERRRTLWIVLAVVSAAVLISMGVVAGLSLRSGGQDGGTATTTPQQGSAQASRIRPVPITPDDLLPASSAPRKRLPTEPPPPAPSEAVDGGVEAGPPAGKAPSRVIRPRGRGTLFLNTRPWCKVRAGGRNLGTTPLINVNLPAGLHSLSLIDANGQRHSKVVRIRPDQATKVFLDFSSTE